MPKYTYNPQTMEYELRDNPKFLKPISIVLLVVGSVAMVFVYFWLYLSVFNFELPKTAKLKRQRAEWETRMSLLDKQLDIYEKTLTGIEQRDDDVYRSIYGLQPIPEELRNSGLEGVNRYTDLERLGANSRLKHSVLRIDNITKRVYLRSKALDEVYLISQKAGDMIACVPSVPPIIPIKGQFRLSSGFGYRTDPVYGGGESHGGQDFALKKGSPVFATGDAVVEKVSYQYRGYGNYIILNHGYGYQTRYAHLNTIEVAEGMSIKRGEKIGTVGSTGKSTGPHLHYEVIYMGKRINPRNFMDTNIPEDEYMAMIQKRSEDSPIGKRASTMELLRKGKATKNKEETIKRD